MPVRQVSFPEFIIERLTTNERFAFKANSILLIFYCLSVLFISITGFGETLKFSFLIEPVGIRLSRHSCLIRWIIPLNGLGVAALSHTKQQKEMPVEFGSFLDFPSYPS